MSWLKPENAKKTETALKEILVRSPDSHDIFTPFALCEEVVSKIPSLDGNILVVANLEFLYTMKMNGVDAGNLFFATPDDMKASVAKSIIPESNVIIYNNVIAKEDINMKFDVVVGNPPYQNDKAATGRKTATKPLWFYFVENVFNITKEHGYVAFITPVAWIQPTSKINKTITSHTIEWVKLFSKNPFKGVGITPSCWIARNEDTVGNTITLSIDDADFSVRLNKDFIPTKPDNFDVKFSLLSKTINIANDKFDVRATQEHHTGSKAAQLNTVEDNIFKYPVFHTNTQRRWSNTKGSLHGVPKVVISKTGSLNGAHVNTESSVSQIGIALVTNTEAEATVALSVLLSKLFRSIIDITRSNSTVPSQLWRSLPAVDLTRTWSDNELYEHFNLTDEEIKLIEATIK